MPKILINEIDYTGAGAPGKYSNYSVLVAGFVGGGDGKTVLPDSNGVYKFSSVQDFKDTIGLVAPGDEYKNAEGSKSEIKVYHYGNKMAHDLLELGYPVVYLPIDNVSALANEDTWKIFKDKANYDFRFITHGLLETSDANINITEEYYSACQVLNDMLNLGINVMEPSNDIEITEEQEAEYIEKIYTPLTESGLVKLPDGEETDVPGLWDSTAKAYYATCKNAVDGVVAEIVTRNALMAELEDLIITKDTFDGANTNIANLAKYDAIGADEIPGRGDCIALIELDEKAYVNANTTTNPEISIIEAINKMSYITKANGKYCAMTVPSVVYTNGSKMPGAFHYLACFLNSLQSGFAEWYAAAGYTRGVSSARIDHTTVTLGEIAINALEPRNTSSEGPIFACNVIANFRGSYYLWGNRTAYPLGDADSREDGDLKASHFLNIRQLCTTIKKQLFVACRRFTFDPNSDTLWFNFVNAIRPTLDNMKADQGIRDYKILKVTEANPQKAALKAKIRIIPIEAVEDFDIEVSLEDSFGETIVTTN